MTSPSRSGRPGMPSRARLLASSDRASIGRRIRRHRHLSQRRAWKRHSRLCRRRGKSSCNLKDTTAAQIFSRRLNESRTTTGANWARLATRAVGCRRPMVGGLVCLRWRRRQFRAPRATREIRPARRDLSISAPVHTARTRARTTSAHIEIEQVAAAIPLACREFEPKRPERSFGDRSLTADQQGNPDASAANRH